MLEYLNGWADHFLPVKEFIHGTLLLLLGCSVCNLLILLYILMVCLAKAPSVIELKPVYSVCCITSQPLG